MADNDLATVIRIEYRTATGEARSRMALARGSHHHAWVDAIRDTGGSVQAVYLQRYCTDCGGSGEGRTSGGEVTRCVGHVPEEEYPAPQLYSPVCACGMAWAVVPSRLEGCTGELVCAVCGRFEELLAAPDS